MTLPRRAGSRRGSAVVVHASAVLGSADPNTDTLLIVDGRVVLAGPLTAVGDVAERFSARCIDLSGHTVLPGLLDAHNHQPSAARDLATVATAHVACIEELLAAVQDAVRSQPAGSWVTTERSLTRAQLRELRYVHARELSAVAPDHPVAVRFGAHSMVLNDLALRRTGLWEADPISVAGAVERGTDGRPTGAIHEYGLLRLVERELPDITDHLNDLELTQQRYLQVGLTGIRVPGVRPGELAWYQQLRRQGRLRHRVHACIRLDPNGSYPDHLDELARYEVSTGFGDDWLGIDGVKLFVDGGIHSADAPTIRFLDRERLERTAVAATRRGWSVTCHAVTGGAIEDVLAAYRVVRDRVGPSPGLAIEHAYEASRADVATAASLGVTLSVQPALVRLNAHLSGPGAVDPVEIAHALRAGGEVVLGSDWNATPGTHLRPYAPLRTVAALLRSGVGFEQAVAAHTVACGRLLGRRSLGHLDVGAVGDLVALPGEPEVVAAAVRDNERERPTHVMIAGRLCVRDGAPVPEEEDEHHG